MKINNIVEFDTTRQTIWVDGQKLTWVRKQNGNIRVCNKLSIKETQLLKYLLEHKNTFVSIETVLETLWIDANFNNKRSADVYITFLRGLLDKYINIETYYGSGWKLTIR
ncbi:MAG: winged helix-turn-helix domain-containing protein [Firmicutes bacterium]|nr:winged helix-turn-helix domain-containing protein [Bacillota bacterium]